MFVHYWRFAETVISGLGRRVFVSFESSVVSG